MAGEFVFLQSTFDARGYDESFKITITTDTDTRITRGSIIELVTNEQFGSVTPYVTLTFIDANSTLMDRTQINPTQLFWVSIVRGADRMFETIPMRMTSLEYNNDSSTTTASTQTTYKLTLVCKSWLELTAKTHCRGWATTKYSDVLSEILTPLYGTVDIEETRNTVDSIVQPHMTNVEFIQDIIKRADPTDNQTMMMFANLFDNTMTIKSRGSLIGELNPFSSRFIPSLTLGGWRSQSDIRGASEDNHGFPDRFMSFNFINHSSDRGIDGNNGIRSLVYDTETSTMVDTTVDIHDEGVKALVKRSTRPTSQTGFTMMVNNGRNTTDSAQIQRSRLIRNLGTSFTLDVVTAACELYRVGQLFTVTLPSSDGERSDSSLFSMSHSGKYMVTGIIHHFDRYTGEFYSRLKLSREGLAYVDETYTLIE